MSAPTPEELEQRRRAMARLLSLVNNGITPTPIAKDIDTVLVWLDYFIKEKEGTNRLLT